jgi:hypothetical protein
MEQTMAPKWSVLVLVLSLATTALNAAIFVSQLATPATARGAAISPSTLLDDDDFAAGLTKFVRKTVRDYCTLGKRDGIDC